MGKCQFCDKTASVEVMDGDEMIMVCHDHDPNIHSKYDEYCITRVGDLRAAIEGLPDDRFVASQVAAEDGSTWIMSSSFTPKTPCGDIAVITLSHPKVTTLSEKSINPSVDMKKIQELAKTDLTVHACAVMARNQQMDQTTMLINMVDALVEHNKSLSEQTTK